jgi:hypothetical protein
MRGVNDMVFPELGVRIAGPPVGFEGIPGPLRDLVQRPAIGLRPSGLVCGLWGCWAGLWSVGCRLGQSRDG